jgi:hypothetical protein
MQGIIKNLGHGAKLDKPAEIHDGHTLAEMPDHRQIMRDKQVT